LTAADERDGRMRIGDGWMVGHPSQDEAGMNSSIPSPTKTST
jgi:hypothetical protein